MTLILGIDPGLRTTGYGLIKVRGLQNQWVASGQIKVNPSLHLSERLLVIDQNMTTIVQQYKPDEVAIEDVFVAKSAGSALKLGHARAAAILAVARCGLSVTEYQPRKVKKSVVGQGGATKAQVEIMVRMLLKLKQSLPLDVADALALAICHTHYRNSYGLHGQLPGQVKTGASRRRQFRVKSRRLS